MPDQPLCDPDRMAFEDLDLTNHEVISAWLAHPATHALHEDLGRAFRGLPAAEQRPFIEAGLAGDERYLVDLSEKLAENDLSDEHRAGLQQVRDLLDHQIEFARRWLRDVQSKAVTGSRRGLARPVR